MAPMVPANIPVDVLRDHRDPMHSEYTSHRDILIGVTIAGHLFMSLVTYFVVNNFQPKRIPDWYAESNRTRPYKACLCTWYLLIFALWPLILPPFLVWHLGMLMSRIAGRCSGCSSNGQPSKTKVTNDFDSQSSGS
jgi:hypothetical protein